MAAVVALEQRRAVLHPHLVGPHARILLRALHRYVECGALPPGRCDGDLLRRHPCQPFAPLPAAGAQQAQAASLGSAGSLSGASVLTPAALASVSASASASDDDLAAASVRKAAASERDGLYPQHPSLYASSLSHVPAAYTQPLPIAVAAGNALASSASAPTTRRGDTAASHGGASSGSRVTDFGALPSSVVSLLGKLPAFDKTEPVATAGDVDALLIALSRPLDAAAAAASASGTLVGGAAAGVKRKYTQMSY